MASWYGYTGPESPEEYLEENVFPILMQGMEEMLQVATKTERRKRFNALDYLVAYLYKHNPRHTDREDVPLEDIPFVKEEWAVNPRPPLPLSATLTEEEAAVIIQSHYRGYRVRKDDKAVLFRTWQRKLWEERKAAKKIKSFLKKKISTTNNPNKKELATRDGEMAKEMVTTTIQYPEDEENQESGQDRVMEGSLSKPGEEGRPSVEQPVKSGANLEVNYQYSSREDYSDSSV